MSNPITNLRVNPGNTQTWLYWDAYPSAIQYTVVLTDTVTSTPVSRTTTDTRYRFANLVNGRTYHATVIANNSLISSTANVVPTAPVFPQFDTLPRVQFVTQEAPAAANTQAISVGDLVLVIGCALDGPIGEPVAYNGAISPQQIFGPQTYDSNYPSQDGIDRTGQYSGNSLMKAAQEVAASGANNIQLVRVGGTVAHGSALILDSVQVFARYAGVIYNGASVSAQSDADGTILQLVQPSVKGPTFSIRYDASDTFDSICRKFNNDPRNRTVQLVCPYSAARSNGASQTNTLTTSVLQGGTNGTLNDDFAGVSKAAYAVALLDPDTGVLSMLEGYPADILFVADVYADDDIADTPTRSMVTDLAVFCQAQQDNGYPTIALIGVRPLQDRGRTAIARYVQDLAVPNTNYDDADTRKVNVPQFLQSGIIDMTDDLGPIDVGRFVVIVTGPDLIFNTPTLDVYTENGAAYIAGMTSLTRPEHALTNQPLVNVTPAFQLSRQQLSVLSAGIGFAGDETGGGAYVTFRESSDGGFVVTSDPTAALRSSNFATLHVVRIVQTVGALVNSVTRPYIGQSNNPATITNLDGELRANLDAFAASGALLGNKGVGYDYTLLASPQDVFLGKLGIQMWVQPNAEIGHIVTSITVS